MAELETNPVRDTIVTFPPERMLYAHATRAEIVVTYRGRTQVFTDPRTLREHFFPDLAPRPTGDELAVTHNGVTRVYASPEAFADTVADAQIRTAARKRQERFDAAPWSARLQFILAERPAIFVGALAALVILMVERLG